MSKILVIDNYDSFVYNLVQYVEDIIQTDVTIQKNDAITIAEVAQFDTILLSPGPGIPNEAGIMMDIIKKYAPTKKILGVCLGQQAIGEAFGANLINLNDVYHGIESEVSVIDADEVLFHNMPSKIKVGRYHSWVVDNENFPSELIITAIDNQGAIMGLRHTTYNLRGVQFHPESIMTPYGKKMLENWLNS